MKIVNDPVYGFISIDSNFILKLIEHPYIQRLRRIKQLGLSHLVYPGAEHTRFQHTLGSYHLITIALEVLEKKGHHISAEEKIATKAAILLHDIGHVPLSHALEYVLIPPLHHEDITLLIMQKLNKIFDNKLSLALEIFKNNYPKKFLYQLISSQLDVDRLDYLKRDSFFCGVPEGAMGTDRIIKMMEVLNNELVIDYKGIYSVEKFLIARRFMFWQVYLHKTSLSAEKLLLSIFCRVKDLIAEGKKPSITPNLSYFFYTKNPLHDKDSFFKYFMYLDDADIMTLLKQWMFSPDRILAELTKWFFNRKLFKTEIFKNKPEEKFINNVKQKIQKKFNVNEAQLTYYFHEGKIGPESYKTSGNQIHILQKDRQLKNIAEISPLINISELLKIDTQYYLSYPKDYI